MAITKIIGAIHPPKSGGRYKVLKNTLNYVMNPEKTKDGYYVGSFNCSPFSALTEMIHTKEHFGKTSNVKSERMGYHMTISWSPEEKVSYDTAFQVIQEFCEKYFGKEYEVVFSVHCDQEHVHSHICFNSVNCENGKKYRYNRGDWAEKIQPLVDEICKKYGLKTLEEDTGISMEEYFKEHILNSSKKKKVSSERGKSNTKYYNEKKVNYTDSEYIRDLIDRIIPECNNFDEFIDTLKKCGFYVKYGKHIAVKGKKMPRFRRLKTLGENYSEEAIRKRIFSNGKEKTLPSTKGVQVNKNSIYIVPLEYRVILGKPMTKTEKIFFAKMEKLSKLNPEASYPTYKNVCERIKQIKKIEAKMKFVGENKITSSIQINEQLEIIKDNILALEKQRKQLYIQRKEYKELIDCYKNLKKDGIQHLLYEETDINKMVFKEEFLHYQELQKKFNDYGFQYDEVEEFVTNLENDIEKCNQAIKEEKQKQEFLSELQKDYRDAEQEYDKEQLEEKKMVTERKKTKRI